MPLRPDVARRRWTRALIACAAPLLFPALAQSGERASKTAGSATDPAVMSRLAVRSVLLGIARAGERLVAVGERGRVLLSDDSGATWLQSAGVPVSVTLVAVTFVDARNGWAVGHGGTVLHTADAGATWQVQLDGVRAAQLALEAAQAQPSSEGNVRMARQWVADGPDKPFLAAHFSDARHGIVVGAYGLIFSTDDSGATWQSRLGDVDNPRGLHLNTVSVVEGRTYIAGERGLILRSDDGRSFAALTSPYDGSWFAMGAMANGGLLLAGLRGNAFSTDNAGESWQKLDVPSLATVVELRSVANSGDLMLVNQGGAVFRVCRDRRVVPMPFAATAPVTDVAQAVDGSWVATSMRGPVRLTVAAALQTSAAATR